MLIQADPCLQLLICTLNVVQVRTHYLLDGASSIHVLLDELRRCLPQNMARIVLQHKH